MSRAVTALVAATSLATGGFTGFEKQVTHVTGQAEPSLAVGPHGRPLVVSYSGCGAAVSNDRGDSFTVLAKHPADPGPTPGLPDHQCSDPATAAGPNEMYTGAGWWDTPGGFVDYYNMYVARSTDGGGSWSKPVYATGDMSAPQALLLGRNTGHSDRLFLTVDQSTGTLYASATDLPRFVRWIVASHDHGATFGPLHAVDSNDDPQVQGEQGGDYIPAAAHGVVAIAYVASASAGRSCPCGIFETSRDDGATWTRHPTPFPANWAAADPSHPGRFAIASGQGVTATPAQPGAIAIAATDDGGRTWTRPVQLGDPSHPQLQPWIAYSPTGVLGVGFKTLHSGLIEQPQFFAQTVAGTLSYTYDYSTAVSFDNGRTFSKPLLVSNRPSPPGNRTGDDFSSVALDDTYLYSAWGDLRKSPTDPTAGPVAVYLARVPLSVFSTAPAARCPGYSATIRLPGTRGHQLVSGTVRVGTGRARRLTRRELRTRVVRVSAARRSIVIHLTLRLRDRHEFEPPGRPDRDDHPRITRRVTGRCR